MLTVPIKSLLLESGPNFWNQEKIQWFVWQLHSHLMVIFHHILTYSPKIVCTCLLYGALLPHVLRIYTFEKYISMTSSLINSIVENKKLDRTSFSYLN